MPTDMPTNKMRTEHFIGGGVGGARCKCCHIFFIFDSIVFIDSMGYKNELAQFFGLILSI